MDRAADELTGFIRDDRSPGGSTARQAADKPREGMGPWVYNPQAGGVRVPPAVRLRTERRIRAYAEAHYGSRFCRLDIRFRGALCYIDAYIEGQRNVPLHLCRLRYFRNEEAWSMAFYTYSQKKYEPCIFGNGTFRGTPEEAFEIAAIYLKGE